ncbi:unnamed protein product [Bodo saltans]|uniref:Uncharacterized protein n=1 Tax=Bodo saltans TaxID=75058 RepID=A0A0S4JSH1_BODSA|nr:unnamed protein product [Bodo saltans]|eukprot:CUG94475.1 unnamed protein product [Bodo saltans]
MKTVKKSNLLSLRVLEKPLQVTTVIALHVDFFHSGSSITFQHGTTYSASACIPKQNIGGYHTTVYSNKTTVATRRQRRKHFEGGSWWCHCGAFDQPRVAFEQKFVSPTRKLGGASHPLRDSTRGGERKCFLIVLSSAPTSVARCMRRHPGYTQSGRPLAQHLQLLHLPQLHLWPFLRIVNLSLNFCVQKKKSD